MSRRMSLLSAPFTVVRHEQKKVFEGTPHERIDDRAVYVVFQWLRDLACELKVPLHIEDVLSFPPGAMVRLTLEPAKPGMEMMRFEFEKE